MEFRVLGTVDVLVNGRSILQVRRRERLLLGLLLLEAGHRVPNYRLIELIWNDTPPKRPTKALQVYVSRLRAQLPAGTSIEFQRDGYKINVDRDLVDVHQFTSIMARIHDVSDLRTRRDLLDQAIKRWHGRPLADLLDESFHSQVGERLEKSWLNAIEMRFTVDLELGRHSSVADESIEYAAQYPHRQSLVAIRMKALYRCSRTSEALDAYHETAAALRDEYGIDTSRELNELYVSMLRSDPDLDSRNGLQTDAITPHQLPPDLGTFVGRDDKLSLLCDRSAPPRIKRARVITVDGMPGIGKSALVIRAAHRVSDQYPDGQVYLDLLGFTAGAQALSTYDALDRLLRVFKPDIVMPHDEAGRIGALRSILANRKVLIILDNAWDARQIEPLIPASSDCLVFVTSRGRLTGLESTARLTIPPFTRQESYSLFSQVVGVDRLIGQEEQVNEIAELCGHLPLAVRIAAARLRDQPHWTLELLRDRLQSQTERLAELDSDDSGILTALEVSYDHLPTDVQQLFRLLSLIPQQPLNSSTAAAIANLTPHRVEGLLATLVTARMIDAVGPDAYRFHDLIRQFAARMAVRDETDASRRAARRRLVEHVAALINVCGHRIDPNRIEINTELAPPNPIPVPERYDQALNMLEANRSMLCQVVSIAHEEELHERVCLMCDQLTSYYELRQHLGDWRSTHELGADSARILDEPRRRAAIQFRLAGLDATLGKLDVAVEGFLQAERLYSRIGHQLGRAAVFNNLGSTLIATKPDNETVVETGVTHLQTAYKIYTDIGDETGQAKALVNLGNGYLRQDRQTDALACFEQSLDFFAQLGRPSGQAFALCSMSEVHSRNGDHALVIQTLNRALPLARTGGSIDTIRRILCDLGSAYRLAGDTTQALTTHTELRDMLEDDQTPDDVIKARQAIAHTLATAGHANAALAELNRAHTTAIFSQNQSLIDSIEKLQAEISESSNQLAEAPSRT